MRRFVVLGILTALLGPGLAQAEGARYLIITPDAFEDALEPLAEWKTRKGMLAKIVLQTDIGYSSIEIQEYIADAVEDWDPAPEYVLLVGDSYQIPYGGGSGDTPYGDIDGDEFVDIHPGRLPATTALDVELMVLKILNHERFPTTEETYYRSATMLVGRDHDDDDWLHYYEDSQWAAGLMEGYDFDNVAILTSSESGATAEFCGMLNEGLAYSSYHGQTGGWSSFDNAADSMTDAPLLPIVLTFTCSGAAYGSAWMAQGSLTDPAGSVGYVGPNSSCSSCADRRSALRRGFWGYVFEDSGRDDVITFGGAVEGARLHYYSVMYNMTDYYATILYGDPELNLWTGVPRDIAVSHPPTVPRDTFDLTVAVSVEGAAHAGAVVGIASDDGIHAVGSTDESGTVTLGIDTIGSSELYITVTGRDLMPYEVDIPVGGAPEPTDDDDDTADDDDTVGDDDDETDDDAVYTDPIEEIDTDGCECSHDGRSSTPWWVLLVAMLAWSRVRRAGP